MLLLIGLFQICLPYFVLEWDGDSWFFCDMCAMGMLNYLVMALSVVTFVKLFLSCAKMRSLKPDTGYTWLNSITNEKNSEFIPDDSSGNEIVNAKVEAKNVHQTQTSIISQPPSSIFLKNIGNEELNRKTYLNKQPKECLELLENREINKWFRIKMSNSKREFEIKPEKMNGLRNENCPLKMEQDDCQLANILPQLKKENNKLKKKIKAVKKRKKTKDEEIRKKIGFLEKQVEKEMIEMLWIIQILCDGNVKLGNRADVPNQRHLKEYIKDRGTVDWKKKIDQERLMQRLRKLTVLEKQDSSYITQFKTMRGRWTRSGTKKCGNCFQEKKNKPPVATTSK